MARPVILLVEDEDDLLSITSLAVRRSLPAYDVVTARTEEEAEDALLDLEATGVPLAMAVVDHVLDGSTGMRLLERLRDRFPHARLILFTGRASVQVEERAHGVGARVLWKPMELSTLLGTVSTMLAESDAV